MGALTVFIVAFSIIWIISPLFRCIIKHLHLTVIYAIVDAFLYVKYRKWERFNEYGISCFVGLFGHGKTLSMIHKATYLYNKFGDRIRFISNVKLNKIPYIELVSFQQLVDLGEDDSEYEGTVVLIDEIENVLNNRNFAKFPLALLHTINQQRKKHTVIYCTSPRFTQIDKMMRIITTNVYNCNKFWRFEHIECFDAWDVENAMNFRDIKRLSNIWWFVKNQDYYAYDTEQMISKDSAEKFISNEEALNRIGEQTQNIGAVTNQSKSYKKSQRQNKKRR